MTYNCLNCNSELIENKNFDWDCPNCGKTFELFHAGFVEPNLREIENKSEQLVCIQCSKQFKAWDRYEDWGFGEIGSYVETDVCSEDCYNEWRLDNREELCN